MKNIPDKNLLLFRSCLVSVEYPGIESSTKYVFDKVVEATYKAIMDLEIDTQFIPSEPYEYHEPDLPYYIQVPSPHQTTLAQQRHDGVLKIPSAFHHTVPEVLYIR